MTPAERIAVALDLTEELRAHLAAGLQHRHPEWPEQRVQAAVAERCLAAQGLRRAEGHYVPLPQTT